LTQKWSEVAMLYTVDVRDIGSELAKAMAEMRGWLDHRRIQL
jgi:hypothetical protein